MSPESAILLAALDYARRGWPVFPCSPQSKAPLVEKESKPGAKDGGLYLASCDEPQIRAWWQRWPAAMIGVPTGARSGGFVIDLDPRDHDAQAMFTALEGWLGAGALHCPLAHTQSGGLHLWFALPADEKIGNRAGLFRKIADAPEAIRQHVDVRGDGGYVIVPPSVMAAGTFYEWEWGVADRDMPPAPQKLIDAILKRLDDKGAGQPAAQHEQQFKPSGESGQNRKVSDDDPVARARHRYAMAALDREISALARVAEGARGFELNKVAYSLGGLVGAGILSESLARRELWTACETNGLAAKDGAEKTWANIDRCLAQGVARPIDLTQIGTRAGTSRGQARGARAAPLEPPPDLSGVPPPAPSDDDQETPASQPGAGAGEGSTGGAGAPDDDALHLFCATLPLTDMGNAQRFMARFGAEFLYVAEWGWLAWDGKRWNGDEADAMVARAVQAAIRAIAEEAHMLRLYSMAFTDASKMDRWIAHKDGRDHEFIDPALDFSDKKGVVLASDRIAGWGMASQSNAHVACVARLAQPYLTAPSDSFDAEAMAFNVDNGTLRFAKREGEGYVTFHAHARADRITKLAPVRYDPQALCPVYDRFLERVQPDAAMRRHLHAWGGLSLTALQLARLSFWYGTGRNGKSTLIDTWAHVMGDYSQTIPIESFLDQGRSRRGGEASPDIAALPGIRCLRTSEPEKGSKLAESLVKLVTGGEPLRARHLNRDFFEFRPAFKMTMQGNYKPRIDGTDEGIWARILLVPWSVMIPEAERDTALPDKLRAEASGILNRLLDGLCDFLDHGLSPPDAVLSATAEYRDDSDPIGRFLNECTARRPDAEKARVAGKDIFAVYVAWAKATGEKPWSPKAFSRGLQDHGVTRLKSSGMHYLNIVLTASVAQFKGEEIEAGDDGH